jgi:sugar lactone lactonase YvrE
VDSAGNIYIADMFNNRIREIALDGVISTVAGNGDTAPFDIRDNDGGQGKDARLWLPQGVAADSKGQIYITDGTTVRQLTPDGVIRSFTGNDCGRHELPGVCAAQGVAVDEAGNIYVADGYCRIRKISQDGDITTVAGDERPSCCSFTFTCGYSGDNGPATSTALSSASGVAVDSAGNVYIADTNNSRIRKVSPDGIMTTIAGANGPSGPFRIIRGGYSGDGGPATDALLNRPYGVAVDRAIF